MAYGYPRSPYHEGDNPFGQLPRVVKTLLIAHAVAQVVVLLVWRISGLPAWEIYRWLGLSPAYGLLRLNVWQFVTYLFVHDLGGVWHLLFNLLTLYFFGGAIERLYGARRFLVLYFGAGVFAGLLHCLFGLVYAPTIPLIGASGAIYAVLVAYALHFPRRRVLLFFVLPIEAWLLVVLLIGLDLLNFLSATGGGVSQLAHLGGAAFGYIFVRHRDRFDRWIDRFSARLEARRAAQAEESEARLDALLDKINREGIGSLTPRERAFLKRASRRYQDRGGR